jgi:hypothetical protein
MTYMPTEEILAERKITQSLALQPGQILKLREMARETGKSVSELTREAVDKFLQEAS